MAEKHARNYSQLTRETVSAHCLMSSACVSLNLLSPVVQGFTLPSRFLTSKSVTDL